MKEYKKQAYAQLASGSVALRNALGPTIILDNGSISGRVASGATYIYNVSTGQGEIDGPSYNPSFYYKLPFNNTAHSSVSIGSATIITKGLNVTGFSLVNGGGSLTLNGPVVWNVPITVHVDANALTNKYALTLTAGIDVGSQDYTKSDNMTYPQAGDVGIAGLTPTALNFLQKFYKSLYDATKSPTDAGQNPVPAETGLPPWEDGSGDINIIQDGIAEDGEGEVAPPDIPVSHVSISKKSNAVIYSEVSSMLRSIKPSL